MSKGTAKKIEPWKTSIAKKLLMKDIIDGKVTVGMKAEEVYEMKPVYKDYSYHNFKNNLKNLQVSVEKLYNAAEIATEGYNNYLQYCANENQMNPPGQNTVLPTRNYPKWDGSEAARFIVEDVDNGIHLSLAPREIWAARTAYKLFPLKVFRDHLNSETRRRKERAYWSYQHKLKKSSK